MRWTRKRWNWWRRFSSFLNQEKLIIFQQSLIKAFYTKTIADNNYLKLYDFTIEHCELNNSIKLTRNPIIGLVYSKLRENKIRFRRCPIPIGETDILKNAEIPLSIFPTNNIKRKVKIALQSVGKISSRNRFVTIFNCTFSITIW